MLIISLNIGSCMSESNFTFLEQHDPIFFQLASSAEQFFRADPNTTLIKILQLSEAFSKEIAKVYIRK